MEEMLEEVTRARQIFERWMQWEPEEEAWMAYVKFEKRYKELERARVIYERFVHIHPEPKNWIKWAEFEEREGKTEKAREIFARAIEVMGEELMEQRLFISFAKFETRQKEVRKTGSWIRNFTLQADIAIELSMLNRIFFFLSGYYTRSSVLVSFISTLWTVSPDQNPRRSTTNTSSSKNSLAIKKESRMSLLASADCNMKQYVTMSSLGNQIKAYP